VCEIRPCSEASVHDIVRTQFSGSYSLKQSTPGLHGSNNLFLVASVTSNLGSEVV
jgi:hypothetical protein